MNSNQIIILSVFLGYLLFNIIVSFVYSKKEEKKLEQEYLPEEITEKERKPGCFFSFFACAYQ